MIVFLLLQTNEGAEDLRKVFRNFLNSLREDQKAIKELPRECFEQLNKEIEDERELR